MQAGWNVVKRSYRTCFLFCAEGEECFSEHLCLPPGVQTFWHWRCVFVCSCCLLVKPRGLRLKTHDTGPIQMLDFCAESSLRQRSKLSFVQSRHVGSNEVNLSRGEKTPQHPSGNDADVCTPTPSGASSLCDADLSPEKAYVKLKAQTATS